MDIAKVAKKPELLKMVLDDEKIVKEYGEPIEFYMYDSVDIHTYFDFYRAQQDQSGTQLNALMRKIIVSVDGKPVIGDEEMLPIDIVFEALIKINENLGKSKTKPSTAQTGNQ
ncbi:hypothetical protein [Brevundimonas sp.]|jgi:hypothetical protein|uniref:hypothetical protein n=1 Tax=Brevundimonas sp. TaxID=1871086 RepID=UPI003784AC60